MPKVRPLHGKVKAIITLGACLSTPAWADDLVVTANRVETEASQLGSSVTVITAEEIERKQAKTVTELLREVPGLSVSSTGGAGRATAIRIRGAESYHTKLIVDGVDLSDPSSSQPQYDFGHLLATDIERIEVVRGPQSLLYGGEAIGGVINIITKRGDGDPKVSAMAEVGSNHSYTGSVGLRGRQDRVSYAMTASHMQTDGISAAEKRNGNSENDPYWNQTLTGQLGVQLTDTWSLDFNGRLMRSQVDYDSWGGGAAADGDDQMDKTERSARLATDFSVFGGVLDNRLAYTISETERDIGVGKAQTSYFDGETQTFEYQGALHIADDHKIVFGAENKVEKTTQASINRDVSANGYYADYQFSPIEALYLTVGGRVDDHEAYGSHTTWRGTAAYLIDATQTRLHGSYGTGFRAPSLYELYHPTWGTSSLRPEESRGWDVGVEQTFLNGKVIVDVTWFDNRLKDLIQWSAAGYTNIASTRAQGVEVSSQWQINDQWQAQGSYTFTDSRNNETGIVLARRPKHQATVGLGWQPVERLSTDATLRMVGAQYDSATGNTVGGFATLDLSAAYDLTSEVQLFGRVENIADKQYQEVDTYGTPGRTAYLGVRAAF
jgi:vitamin B12 transporter